MMLCNGCAFKRSCLTQVYVYVRVGLQFRQQLDIYLPKRSRSQPGASADPPRGRVGCPVVVFVSGGAWVIGYKVWGFLMGITFQHYGACVEGGVNGGEALSVTRTAHGRVCLVLR